MLHRSILEDWRRGGDNGGKEAVTNWQDGMWDIRTEVTKNMSR